MYLADLLSELEVLNQRALLVFVIVIFVGAAFIALAERWRRKRGWRAARTLDDQFKTRQKRRSSREQRALARGNSVVLGKHLQVWPRQKFLLPESARCLNVLNLGPTGVGKTTYFVTTFIAQDMVRPEVALVLFDGQQDITEPVLALAEQYHRTVVVYPDVGFNPLAGSGGPQERATRFADLFAQVSETGTQGAAGYYLQKAQSFLRKVIPLYERAYGQPMILQELVELCLDEGARERVLAAAANTPEGRDFRLFFRNWSKADFDKNLAGFLNFVDRLTVGHNAALYNQRHAPTLAECLEQKQVVIIREGGPQKTEGHTLGLLYMVSLQEYTARRNVATSPHLVACYVDEAHLYFNSTFPTFIATSRKRHMALHLGFQSFAQLEPHRQVITTNARTWVIHAGLLHEDAQVVADTIGKRLFRTRSWSSSQGQPPHQTISHSWEYLVPSHEIRGLSADQALVLTVAGREVAAHALVQKPKLLTLPTRSYDAPQVSPYPPPTIWQEQEQTHPAPGPRQAPGDW